MGDELPAPLVPADRDLRDFPRMPLDVDRLRRSRSWLIAKKKPELGFYMFNLWSAAWHEKPPGSLEDDPETLADRAMCKPERWAIVSEVVMRNWIKCSDGRLYHTTVAEMVEYAWASKVAQRQRTKAATEARERNRREAKELFEREQAAQRHVERDVQRDDARDVPAVLPLNGSHVERDVLRDVERDEGRDVHQGREKGEGEGERDKKKETLPAKAGEGRFGEFWTSWPNTERKVDRKKCLAKWRLSRFDEQAEEILSHIQAMKPTRKWTDGYEPAPLRYLNGEQWKDGVVVSTLPRDAGPRDRFVGNEI